MSTEHIKNKSKTTINTVVFKTLLLDKTNYISIHNFLPIKYNLWEKWIWNSMIMTGKLSE